MFFGVAFLAELMVRLFGNWLLFFRRFAHRLAVWLGILGISGYLSFFCWRRRSHRFVARSSIGNGTLS